MGFERIRRHNKQASDSKARSWIFLEILSAQSLREGNYFEPLNFANERIFLEQ